MGSSGSTTRRLSLMTRRGNAKLTVLAVTLVAHLVHPNSTLVSTSLFRDTQGELVVVTDQRMSSSPFRRAIDSPPCNPLDGRRVLPCLQALSRLDIPQLHRVVGGPGKQQLGLGYSTSISLRIKDPRLTHSQLPTTKRYHCVHCMFPAVLHSS